MSNRLLQLDHVSFTLTDGRRLLSELNYTFSARCTGIVGSNGCGKSLLGCLLAGKQVPGSGNIRCEGRVYHVSQLLEPKWYPTVAALAGVAPVLAALARIEQGSLNEDDYALATDQWDCRVRLEAALADIGLGHLELDSPTSVLSGGERQRIALLGASLSQADWLILDEPSNHLDIEQRQRLATQIDRWPNGLVLISHDRTLLEHVDEIVELSTNGIAVYGGNYSQYAAQRDQDQAAFQATLQRERAHAKREQREMLQQLERQQRRSARGERQAKEGNQSKLITDAQKESSQNSLGKLKLNQQMAREKQQQRITEARARCVPEMRRMMLAPESSVPNGKLVLQLQDVVLPFGYGEPINFSLTGPVRMAVKGANGSGKSTLIKVIAGHLEPIQGMLMRNCNIGWLDQYAGLQHPERSALEWLREANSALPESEARTRLAQIGIDAARTLVRTEQLSGGERLKVAFAAQLYAQTPPQLLLLDEPDNHLDLPSRLALEQMLNQYQGALIVVSHDLAFLKAIDLVSEIELTRCAASSAV